MYEQFSGGKAVVAERIRIMWRSVLFVWVLLVASPVWAAESAESPLWSAAWITDTQTAECDWITALIERLKADKPKLVLHTGDTRFEWANRCAWRDVLSLLRVETPPIEFHLAPGNHDLEHGVLKPHLRRAASRGIYRLDTGRKAPGQGYYHDRVTKDVSGPAWPVWNPQVARHPAWQPQAKGGPYRYVFKRGGIRFIVCDCYYTDEQRDWIRKLIVQPDDSSVTIILHHKHEVDDLAKYVEGLEGQHNVKLILSGDHHHFGIEQRYGVTFITAAGMANGHFQESDAMTLWVYKDHLRLDRYVLPKGLPRPPVQGPVTIWTCGGNFSEYRRPVPASRPQSPQRCSDKPAASEPRRTVPESDRAETLPPNLLYNGDFDNRVWYERFRGWSPAGWYQWFTRGGHAPEHACGRYPSPPFPAHSGREFVRIHMWGHAWRGGILQVVRGVEPCHWYRMTAYGCFQPTGAPEPHARIGIDPCGTLAKQYSVDVTKHPAPKYDEGVGDDPKTPQYDGPDITENTIWSDYHDYYRWGKFEVQAEARSDAITAILYCAPKQRPPSQPIYEMNWDTVALREIPWPTKRLVADDAVLVADKRLNDVELAIQPWLGTAQVTWASKIPAGASQVVYRLVPSAEAAEQSTSKPAKVAVLRSADFPFETPVVYERSAKRHCVQIELPPQAKMGRVLEVVAMSRMLIDGRCVTLSSAPVRAKIGQGPAKR